MEDFGVNFRNLDLTKRRANEDFDRLLGSPPHVVAYTSAGATTNPLYVNTSNGDVLKPL